jgi:hypothetical protein
MSIRTLTLAGLLTAFLVFSTYSVSAATGHRRSTTGSQAHTVTPQSISRMEKLLDKCALPGVAQVDQALAYDIAHNTVPTILLPLPDTVSVEFSDHPGTAQNETRDSGCWYSATGQSGGDTVFSVTWSANPQAIKSDVQVDGRSQPKFQFVVSPLPTPAGALRSWDEGQNGEHAGVYVLYPGFEVSWGSEDIGTADRLTPQMLGVIDTCINGGKC